MDGQRPSTSNGSKEVIPGVAGANLFLPSLFAQPPTSSADRTNATASDIGQWAKNPAFQNWVDTQTKNLQYNMFTGNVGTNGTFGSTLDNAWQNSSPSQPNLNLLAAFQQQYGGAKNTTSSAASSSSSLNPLMSGASSSSSQRGPASSFDPLSIHPQPSARNPPISQPKQPPKHPTITEQPPPLFASLPGTSTAPYGVSATGPADKAPFTTSLPGTSTATYGAPGPADKGFPYQPSFDQLRDLMSGHLTSSSSAGGATQPFAPIARPQPRAGLPQQTFDDLLSSVRANSDTGFNLNNILPPPPITESLTSPHMPSVVPGILSPTPTTTSSLMAPTLQIPSTSALSVPPSEATLISPRSGLQKRRSGGQNGEMASDAEGELDIDLGEGFDLFFDQGITMADQEAVLLESTLYDSLFNGAVPVSATDPLPPQPKPVEAPPPKVEEPKKEEVSSASSKMALLRARLNKNKAAVAPPPPPPPPTPHKNATPTPIAAPVAAPMQDDIAALVPPLFHKPATPLEKADKLTFSAPNSPIDLSDHSKASTSGISSLIAASILPSELLLGRSDTPGKKKTVPVYLRPQSTQPPAAIPVYKQKEGKLDTKGDEFAFTDEDPEEIGEKLFREEESEEEPENLVVPHETKSGDKEARISTYIKGLVEAKETEKEPRSIKLESKKPAPVYPGRDKHARAESLEFAERLRKRWKEIANGDFINVQQCEHNQCAIDSFQKNVEDEDKPPLPRLLIRLPKRSIGSEERRRRKKKRQYYDEAGEDTEEDDDDWYGGRPKRRRGRKPKRELHPDETYSVRLVDPSTIEHARREVQFRPKEYMTRKEKIRHWKEENASQPEAPAANGRGVPGRLEPKSLAKIVAEFKTTEAHERLEKFKHCSGFTPRGTFLVLKAEINTPDCALWRVDNMNLLQKFPGFMGRTDDGGQPRLLYKNSSTYSGWCEQLQPGYMVVEVRHVKHTRSECVVEPVIHVNDLFPAISEDVDERYCVSSLKALINKEDSSAQLEARAFILKDDVRNGLFMVIKNMLEGALAFDYFSSAKEPTIGGVSNPCFELLEEMECQVRECEEIIRERVAFGPFFESHLKMYSSCLVVDYEFSEMKCQACDEQAAENTLQLFDLIVDSEKKADDDLCYDEQEGLLPAVDFLLCDECCKCAAWLHRLTHFRIDLARRIENRLLEGTLEMPALLPDQVLDNLRQSYTWLKELIVAHADTWDAIMASEETGEEPLQAASAEVAIRNGHGNDALLTSAGPAAHINNTPKLVESILGSTEDDDLIDPVTI